MRTVFHAPLSRALREAHAACAEADATGAPIGEVTAWRAEQRAALPRRGFLAGAAALAVPGAARAGATASAGNKPTVIIVGAGLAGLACARTLWLRYGIAASIYEWSGRAGGRVQTLRGAFAGGITAELHGQFISSEHTAMRALAAGYGLPLADANIHLGLHTHDTGWYAGQRYTAAQLAADWHRYAFALFRAAARAAPSATYRHASPEARAWDRLSVTDWVQKYVPGGTAAPLGALCLADVVSEFGSPPEQQSALNLIGILGFDASTKDGLQARGAPVVAGSDEKYQVIGGNDLIVTGMLDDLPAAVMNTGTRLLAIRQTAGRRLRCTFQADAATIDVTADHVVLAIPPTTMRDVTLTGIDLLPVQRRAIAGATLGNNAKIFIQVAGRPWLADGFTGTLLTDVPVCGGWDASNTQPGGRGHDPAAVFVGFPGGRQGATLAARYGLTSHVQPAPAALVADTLAQLDPALPGMTAAWRAGPGNAWVADGNADPMLRGAYSNFLVGQYTSFAGGQSLRAGNLHFAGEHTSLQYQGYMEGAVRSGLRAAQEILGAAAAW